MRLLKPIVLAFFYLNFIVPLSFAVEYEHEIVLKRMTFAWKVARQQLYVKLTGETTGWVGIGFNPTHQMKDANYVLGYVKRGKVKMIDAFGVRAKEHIKDTLMEGSDNVTVISGKEEGNTTTIEFSIPLDSGDVADGKIEPTGLTTVLLAFGKRLDNFYSRHAARFILTVNLTTGEYKK